MFRPIVSTYLQQIIEMCYKINNTGQLFDEPKDMPAVILKFNGDTGFLDLYVYPEGKYRLSLRHLFRDVELDKDDASEKLEEIIKILDLTYHNKKLKEKMINGK